MGRALPAARQGQKREGARCRRSAVAHASLRLPADGCQSDGRQALVGGGEGRQGRQLVPYSLWIRVKSASSASVACTRSSFFNSKNKTPAAYALQAGQAPRAGQRPPHRGNPSLHASGPCACLVPPGTGAVRRRPCLADRRAHFHHSACQLQHPALPFFLSGDWSTQRAWPAPACGALRQAFRHAACGRGTLPIALPCLGWALAQTSLPAADCRPQAGLEPPRPPGPARPPHQCKEHVQSHCHRMPETLPWTRLTGRC